MALEEKTIMLDGKKCTFWTLSKAGIKLQALAKKSKAARHKKIKQMLQEYFNVHTIQIEDESSKHKGHSQSTGGHFKLNIISFLRGISNNCFQ